MKKNKEEEVNVVIWVVVDSIQNYVRVMYTRWPCFIKYIIFSDCKNSAIF